MTNPYLVEWDKIEDEATRPRKLREIKIVQFDEFKKKVYGEDPAFVKELVESLYAGDVYVLKGAFSKEYFEDLKKKMFAWGKQSPSSFHKMLEGVPDFHRVIDKSVSKNYSFQAIKHSYYFFPWNDDQFGVFEPIWERWRVLKFLGGYNKDEYEKNTPKDGVIDRIQFVHYPSGAGELETHSDPYLNQRTIISGMMSKRGEDYKEGGVYFVGDNDEKVDAEEYLDVGDMCIAYATVLHGVAFVDKGVEVDWDNIGGRWFLGLYFNDTDYKKDRHTGYAVKK